MAQIPDIGIDLGTDSVVIYGRGKGLMLKEPAVIAVERETRNVLAVGIDARRMMGRTPSNILAMRPLREGMIADFEMTSAMLRYFVAKVVGKHLFGGPRIVIAMPAGINDVERHSIVTSLFEMGARRTQIMERPVAAAIGAGLDIGGAYGKLICNIGGGITDIAVLSMGKTVVRDSVKVAGDQLDDAIVRYVRRKHNMLLGELTAEDIKVAIGSAMPRDEQLFMEVTGRNLISGMPKVLRINSDEVTEAMEEVLHNLVERIHVVLEHTPAELAADIFETGITLSGGGAMLSGLAEYVESALKMKCVVADAAPECVAHGCALVLENRTEFGKFVSDRKRRAV